MGIGRLPMAMANMARVDVGLDETQPNLRAVATCKVQMGMLYVLAQVGGQ